MTRHALVAFLCLVALTATESSDAVKTKYYQVGEEIEFGPIPKAYEDDVEKCELITNNGNKLVLYPNSNVDGHRFQNYAYDGCRTTVYRITEKDTGSWQVQATVTKNSGKTLDIKSASYNVQIRKVYDEKPVFPAKNAYAYPDQQVSIYFAEKYDNLASCKLLSPDQVEYDLGSDASANIKLSGECGFKMTVKKDYDGEWTLIADLKNSTAYHGSFKLMVRNKDELNVNQTVHYFKRGEEAYVNGDRRMEIAKMCILEDPHGVKMPINNGLCSYRIPIVTEHHQGVWKAYYGVEGIENLVEQTIIVKTYDATPLNSTISRSANGDINLLCQVRTHSIKFCSFVRPDGKMLHMTMAVGNNKYAYYGNGVHNTDTYITDCGITIHKPTSEDYGSWKCLVRVSPSETFGKIMKVTPATRSSNAVKPVITANDVYAKTGDSYKIKCSADEVLSYCWLRSPNGTVHNVQRGNNVRQPALAYDGAGLELGDCTARVEEATESDAGKWTCHVGVNNGPELETDFKVILKDTHLMAARDIVILDSRETDLICRPLPNSNKIIEACRWVNPLGHGINVDRQGRYFTETGSTHCRLTIRVVNFEEDLGEWSCHARFSDSLEEGSARLIVTYARGLGIGSFLSIGLVVSLLVCTSVGLFVLVVYKRRLAASRRLDEKIILEKPSKYP